MQIDLEGCTNGDGMRQCHAQKKRRIQDDSTSSTPIRRSDCWKPPGVTAVRFRTSSTGSTRPAAIRSHACWQTDCNAWFSGSGQSHRENRPTQPGRSGGVLRDMTGQKLLSYRRDKDSNADALAGASTRANIAMKRDIHIGAENDSTDPREHLESRHRHGR